jgi:two-component system response regulator RstA
MQESNAARNPAQSSLQIDIQKRVAIVDGKVVNLTSCEFDLLSYFFANQGVILTREEIYRQMRGIEWDGADRSIDLRVSRLRNKIDDNGKSPRFIKSVRGTGYMLVCQDS